MVPVSMTSLTFHCEITNPPTMTSLAFLLTSLKSIYDIIIYNATITYYDVTNCIAFIFYRRLLSTMMMSLNDNVTVISLNDATPLI